MGFIGKRIYDQKNAELIGLYIGEVEKIIFSCLSRISMLLITLNGNQSGITKSIYQRRMGGSGHLYRM